GNCRRTAEGHRRVTLTPRDHIATGAVNSAEVAYTSRSARHINEVVDGQIGACDERMRAERHQSRVLARCQAANVSQERTARQIVAADWILCDSDITQLSLAGVGHHCIPSHDVSLDPGAAGAFAERCTRCAAVD